ncbi:hypothetical protein GXW83_22325 [Streptacidiphilus sp. PB12-B1b]|uniref:hypothetical protein n=1 Tax=Streptacidiphilus sp. PB12-B1b TaxID=2705012 RepID=UPI0015FCF21D|nr:hypothetical protein [Streptacidiphilus sp. PB12-B1b]QMU78026.1 hypothetical protein GXW83_22325 [Streptacidiphilus sp. PB12-B1b]
MDIAARAWMSALALFAAAQPGGFYRAGDKGTSELVTGAPVALLNGVISTAGSADAEEVADFADSPRLGSVPRSVQVRGEQVAEGIAAVATGHGLERRTLLPFMVKQLGDDLRGPEGGVTVRRVTGDESELYRTVMAAGYGGPEEIFLFFTARSLMDHVSMRAYLTEVGGVAVATSFGIRVADAVGVFNIAVLPDGLPARQPTGGAAVPGNGIPARRELDRPHRLTPDRTASLFDCTTPAVHRFELRQKTAPGRASTGKPGRGVLVRITENSTSYQPKSPKMNPPR